MACTSTPTATSLHTRGGRGATTTRCSNCSCPWHAAVSCADSTLKPTRRRGLQGRLLTAAASCAAVRTWSGPELPHQLDIFLSSLVGAHAAQARPGFVLRGVDEIEEAGFGAVDVAIGGLLVERVEFQEGVVVRALGQTLDVFGSLPEFSVEFAGHGGAHAFGLARFVVVRGLAVDARPERSSCARASMRADSSWISDWFGMFMRLAARAMRSSNACSSLPIAALVRLRAASIHGVAWSCACFICSWV